MSKRLILSSAAAMAIFASPAAAQGAPPAPVTDAELTRRLNTSLDSLSALDQFSGIVVLSRAGMPIFQRAVGMADREAARANTIETAFNLGSINKIFTMTAIRQLAAAGKIDLDSTLVHFLPDYPNKTVAGKVTIRQLMQMRSGIGGNIFGLPAGGKRSDVRHNRDYLPLFVNEPMEFEPGTQNKYSNAGFVVLGLVIERVSGEDYYAYVKRHIYDVAGMTRTAAYAVDSLPPSTAIGYTRGDLDNPPPNAPLRRNSDMLPGRGSAAGGGYSTAHDLLAFLDAIRAHRIPGAPLGGLGIAGGAPGMNATVDSDLPGALDVLVLAKLDPPAAPRVAHWSRP